MDIFELFFVEGHPMPVKKIEVDRSSMGSFSKVVGSDQRWNLFRVSDPGRGRNNPGRP